MRHYESSVSIDASPEVVWSILTDGPGYAEWDNGVERCEGTIALGEKIKVHAEINPGRAFPVRVTELVEPRAMTWSGGMPLGLFKGVRTFRLSPTADGGTDFVMREEFSGPLLGMIWKSMPDLAPAFEQFARGLEAEAEKQAGG